MTNDARNFENAQTENEAAATKLLTENGRGLTACNLVDDKDLTDETIQLCSVEGHGSFEMRD